MDKLCSAQNVKYPPPPSQDGAFCSCVDVDGLKHNPDDKSGIIYKDIYVPYAHDYRTFIQKHAIFTRLKETSKYLK